MNLVLITTASILLVAVMHIGFLVLEMHFWTKPLGRKIFRLDEEKAKSSAALAANQGLYNGFLAAGLFWSLVHPDPLFAKQLPIFFPELCRGRSDLWYLNCQPTHSFG
jgi:putative membrane protein